MSVCGARNKIKKEDARDGVEKRERGRAEEGKRSGRGGAHKYKLWVFFAA